MSDPKRLTHAEFAKQLRELANIYEANGTLPLPSTLRSGAEIVFCHTDEQFSAAREAFGDGHLEIDAPKGRAVFTPHRFPIIKIAIAHWSAPDRLPELIAATEVEHAAS